MGGASSAVEDGRHLAAVETSMHRTAAPTMMLFCLLACASRGSTSLTSSWRAPEPGPWEFHRVLTSFVSTDLPLRRSVEDRLATRIPGSFAAYSTLPGLSVGDSGAVHRQLRGKLFDGVVVVRVMGLRSQPASLPASAGYAEYPGFYRYWQTSWTMLRDPGYVPPDSQVQVEIVVYSLAHDRLVWAGRTTTTSAEPLQEVLDHSVDVAVSELASKRVLP
jgi:hypothetical protein